MRNLILLKHQFLSLCVDLADIFQQTIFTVEQDDQQSHSFAVLLREFRVLELNEVVRGSYRARLRIYRVALLKLLIKILERV